MVKMPRRWNASSIIVIALMAIGFVYMLLINPGSLLIPIIIFGGIFLLYKYPPSSWGGNKNPRPYVKQNRTQPQQRPKSRRAPFRVIEGGKDDDDELPKYH